MSTLLLLSSLLDRVCNFNIGKRNMFETSAIIVYFLVVPTIVIGVVLRQVLLVVVVIEINRYLLRMVLEFRELEALNVIQ